MKKLYLGLILISLFAACGEQNSNTKTCEASVGENHVAQAAASPSGNMVMLHVEDRSCSVVGKNRYHLMKMNSEGSMDMAPLFPAAATGMTGMSALVISSVKASMTGMGHGTSQPEEIDSNDPSWFTVAYQMPGSWQLDIGFAFAAGMTAQSVSFAIEVQ